MNKLLVAIAVVGIGVLLAVLMKSGGSDFASAAQTDAAADWKQVGQKTYSDNCLLCHGPAGAGMGKMYPSLKEVGALSANPVGRDYLIDVQLYGADSDRHTVAMAPMAHLRDNELAAVLNHITTSFGNKAQEAQLFTAEEVAKRRGQKSTASDVGAKRPPSTQPVPER